MPELKNRLPTKFQKQIAPATEGHNVQLTSVRTFSAVSVVSAGAPPIQLLGPSPAGHYFGVAGPSAVYILGEIPGRLPEQARDLEPPVALQLSREIAELNRVIMQQSAEIRELKELVKDGYDTPQPILVPITTFAPRPFEVAKTIMAVVEPVIPDDPTEDWEYVAEYVEAHVGASGDTVQDAVGNLKDRLLSTLELLEKMPKLSKRLQGQLAILQSVIRRCPEEAPIK